MSVAAGPGSFSVRDAGEGDFGPAADVLLAAYAEFLTAMTDAVRAAVVADIEAVRARGAGADARGTVLVAETGGVVAGTVTYFRGTEYADRWPAAWCAFRLLGVAPWARGRGIGRGLAAECVRRAAADGAQAIGLHTTTAMRTAAAMYERMGFVRAPAFDVVYRPGLTVLGYLLTLHPDLDARAAGAQAAPGSAG